MSQDRKLLILGIFLAIVNVLFFWVLNKIQNVSPVRESIEIEKQSKVQKKKRLDVSLEMTESYPAKIADDKVNEDKVVDGPALDYKVDITPPGIVINIDDIPPEELVNPVMEGGIDFSITPESDISEDEVDPPGIVINMDDIPPEELVSPVMEGGVDFSITPDSDISEDEVDPPGIVINMDDISPEEQVNPIMEGGIDFSITPESDISEDEVMPSDFVQ
jgi:hypothetical protein